MPRTGRTRGRRRIGLLGGSFNPAHDGHRHISVEALRRLALDEVWWLVSPQNPLKPMAGMAPFNQRLAAAQQMAGDRRIRVSDLEMTFRTRFTVDTLAALRRRYPDCRFVWLMGADNLTQLPRWRRWRHLVRTTAIAVFARPGHTLPALCGPVARRLAPWRLAGGQAASLAGRRPPAWIFLAVRPNPASASAIRAAAAPGAVAE
ncbi:MAG: nicotinate-nucleotide adenylyltransferase [Alphaproteobacteria bacterium]